MVSVSLQQTFRRVKSFSFQGLVRSVISESIELWIVSGFRDAAIKKPSVASSWHFISTYCHIMFCGPVI
jgi:hypothetical protein